MVYYKLKVYYLANYACNYTNYYYCLESDGVNNFD